MRILQLNSARKFVGEAAHTLNLTESLRRRGHHVVLGLREGFDTIKRARERQLGPLAFNFSSRFWPPKDTRDLRRIAQFVRAEKLELIHAHRSKEHWLALAAVRLFRLKIPVLRTRHVVTPLSANPANRWLARHTAAIVAVSRAVEADIRRANIFAPERIAFIPGGIDLELFRPADAAARTVARMKLELAPDAPVVFCVARFAIVKAHRVLVAAWRRVHEKFPTARLVLVGGGPLLEETRAQAAQLGLSESILFVGRRYDVPELLDAADWGVLASVGSEGFSRAVLEYMAKGLPCVATRVGAVPDLVEDGANGRLVTPDDSAALATALLEALYLPPPLRIEWAACARRKAETGYGYEAWARRHEALYASVLE